MPRRTIDPVSGLRDALEALIEESSQATLTDQARRKLQRDLRTLAADLDGLLGRLDPIAQPSKFFDPGDPRLMGRFVALGLMAQERQPLAAPVRTYGSGVYAIYYRGGFAPYQALSSTETPIYVGQAAPNDPNAETPPQQGVALYTRLNDHRRSLSGVSTTLAIEDFEYRSLVVHTGWETPAEDYLIQLFKPIWNKEMRLVYGIGKHGDSATTRDHPRSPWHTLHPGRGWADGQGGDAKSQEQIESELVAHFAQNPPYRDIATVLESFFADLRQA